MDEYLKLQIAKLKRLQCGRSSEQLDTRIGQLEPIVEDLEATQVQSAPVARRESEAGQVPPYAARHSTRLNAE